MNTAALHCDVAVAGAGPVGLALANLLGARGLSVIVLEARESPVVQSMAIGITPPSLKILSRFGATAPVLEDGVRICRARVHEEGREAGILSFASADDGYPWIVSLPQSRTEAILNECLLQWPAVRLLRGHRVEEIRQRGGRVELTAVETNGRRIEVDASCAVACDGARGVLREKAGIGARVSRYRPLFRMADAVDETDLGRDAHLFFNAERPVESFPLPGGRRRWIVRCGWDTSYDLHEPMGAAVTRLTGYHVPDAALEHASEFRPWRMLASRYFNGRVVLCGDAAHVMSPIGGQGMNTGFADADMLAGILARIVKEGAGAGELLAGYEHRRRKAFRVAAARAAAGMALGVWTGAAASAFRGMLVRRLLGRSSSSAYLARWFAMTSLPYRPGGEAQG